MITRIQQQNSNITTNIMSESTPEQHVESCPPDLDAILALFPGGKRDDKENGRRRQGNRYLNSQPQNKKQRLGEGRLCLVDSSLQKRFGG